MRVSGQLNFLFTFTPRKITPVIHHTGGFMWPRTGLDNLEKISFAARGNRTVIPGTPVHYNDHKNSLLHLSALHCAFSAGQDCLQSKSSSGSFFPPQVSGQEGAAKSVEHLAVGTASVLRSELGLRSGVF
jgi:hypothetical protein